MRAHQGFRDLGKLALNFLTRAFHICQPTAPPNRDDRASFRNNFERPSDESEAKEPVKIFKTPEVLIEGPDRN